MDGLSLCSSNTHHTILLVLAQPRLLGVTQKAAAEEVADQTENDQHEGNRVQVVDRVSKDLRTDNDTPEVAGEQRDVHKGRAAHAEHQRNEAVEHEHEDGEADDVTRDVAVKACTLEGVTIEDGGDDAVDDEAEETNEGEDVVHGGLGNEPFFKSVAETVAGCTGKSKHITLDRILAAVGARKVVGGDEDAHTANGDEDTDNLGDLVADLEDEEGDDDDDGNSPEVDELRRQDVCVAVRQNRKVVTQDVKERHDDVLPPVGLDRAPPTRETLKVEEHGVIHNQQRNVVEHGLERGDVDALADVEQGGEGVGGRDAQSEDLAESADEPEVTGGEVVPPVNGTGFENAKALLDGLVVVVVGAGRGRAVLLGGRLGDGLHGGRAGALCVFVEGGHDGRRGSTE